MAEDPSVEEPSQQVISVFCKVGKKVVRARWTVGGTMQDLQQLFRTHFTKEIGTHAKIPPIYIFHRATNQQYELEDLSDIYQYAVLEIKDVTFGRQEVKTVSRTGFGMYGLLIQREKLILVMVGLPARGKSYIASRVSRYLNWIGVATRVFNVGSYRRARIGAHQTHDFFDPKNEEGNKARFRMAVAALDDMINWVHSGGRVAIYDGTNSTEERRQLVLSRCRQEGFEVMFIESLCEDPQVINFNVRETRTNMPDYAGVDPETAISDFLLRIEEYKKSYQTITNESLSYVKIIDVGRKLIVNNINSYLEKRIVFFLSNLHLSKRPIWLTRHGESASHHKLQVGGNADLSPTGELYAQALAEWVEEQMAALGAGTQLTVWTSTLKRTIQTAQYIPCTKLKLRGLDEIDAGICDGLSYDEIAEMFPEEFANRAADKLRYRYPQGESYEDVLQRLEPVILELERQRNPVLVVSHQAVVRCLYGYFMEKDMEQCPFLNIPLHHVVQITPSAYGCKEEWFSLTDRMSKLM